MRKYIHQRLLCGICGRYDRRVRKAPKSVLCDHCGGPAELMQECRGQGKVEVPWIGKASSMLDGEFTPGKPQHEHWKRRRFRLSQDNSTYDATLAPVREDEVKELLETLQ